MSIRSARPTGFTLVELMIVVAIAVIIASLAWPSFTNAVNKSRRAEAFSALAQITQAQERWRANNPQYQDTLSSLPGASAVVTAGGNYSLAMVANSVSDIGYTVTATVSGVSQQANDTICQVLQVEMSNGNILYTSRNASSANPAPDPCWVR
jgi:type IV pilus assembly protein PilE